MARLMERLSLDGFVELIVSGSYSLFVVVNGVPVQVYPRMECYSKVEAEETLSEYLDMWRENEVY